jgi:DNA-binding CsgD family transcriptional regulator
MYTETLIKNLFTDAFCMQEPIIAGAVGLDLKAMHITNYAANLHGFNHYEKVLGLSCYESNSAAVNSAPEFEQHHKKVIYAAKPLNVLDIHTYADGSTKLLSTTKSPMYNSSNDITGCFEVCKNISSTNKIKLIHNAISSLSKFIDASMSISISLEIIDCYDMLSLNRRESECLYFIMRGYTNREIGNRLHISMRTVDDYASNIKTKLNCRTRSEIIDYAVSLNLIKFIPKSLL